MPEHEAQGTEKKRAAPQKPATWSLRRRLPDGKWEVCAMHKDGVRLERFPVLDGGKLPTIQQIGEVWGSGRYKVQPFTSGNRSMGWRAEEEFDHPSHPRREAYAGRPEEPEPPPPPAPLPPPPSPPAGGIAGLLGPGGAQAFALMSWMDGVRREAAQEAEAAAQRRHELAVREMEARQLQSERFAQLQIETIRASSQQTIEQQQAHFRAMAALMGRDGGERDDDDDDDESTADKVISALDAIGIDDEQRKAIAPGFMAILGKLAKKGTDDD